jgi:opacity protein-like surface antigen
MAPRLLKSPTTMRLTRVAHKGTAMKTRMTLAAVTVCTLASSLATSSAFAQEAGAPASDTSPKMRLGAQVEVLPVGSGKATVGDTSMTNDAAVAYGVTGTFDYALTPYLSVGVAPRLVLNVTPDNAAPGDRADKELDLRARVLGHFAVAPKLEVYAAVAPGYAIVMSGQDGINNSSGFAIGGAAGVTYDVSPKMFLSGEVGYQRAFTSTDITVGNQTMTGDLALSYMHVGLGAGTRF